MKCKNLFVERYKMSERVYKRKNGKWEARYVRGKFPDGRTRYGSVFADTKEEAIAKREVVLGHDPTDPFSQARLNIIILGAGSFGREVKETLERLHLFKEIAFLDDFSKDEDVIGKCEDADLFRMKYPCAFVAIGDNAVRRKYAKMLVDCGFYIPTVISPDAIVSTKAQIGVGSMVFAQANVGAASIGNFCLVQANGVVNPEANVGNFCRIDNSAIVLKGENTPEEMWLKPGKIYGEV
jgi:acetyltransferase-like isoleucine patch superfamily enzyme